MTVVLKCPVCGSEKIRETTGTISISGEAPSTTNYRCKNGHSFFVMNKPPQVK